MSRGRIAVLAFGSALAWAGLGPAEEPRPSRCLLGHRGMVTSVAFSPSGDRLVSTGLDHTVRLWSVASGQVLHVLAGHADEAGAAAFSLDGRYVASAGYDRRLLLWDAASGRRVQAVTLPSWSTALAFLPGGDLVVATQGEALLVVQVPSGEVVRRLDAPALNALAVAAAGRALFAGGPLSLRDVGSWEVTRKLKAPGGVTAVAASKDGRRLASGHRRGVAYVWDGETGDKVQTVSHETERKIAGPGGPVMSPVAFPIGAVALSPDGTRLATAGVDPTVRLWDVAAGTLIQGLDGHTRQVTGLAWSPDGRLVASSSADGSVRLWNVDGIAASR